MKDIYEQKIQLMLENYEVMKKPFKWDLDMARHLVALTYAMKDQKVDVEKIAGMKKYIKSSTGSFSPFRGNMMFAIAGMLSVNSDHPEQQLDKMAALQPVLKSVGFKQSMYQPMALYALTTAYRGEDPKGHLEKAKAIHKEMKANHPFLTSGDDYALAILLADTEHKVDDLEAYYQDLNQQGFTKSNGLQMLSHILAFSNKTLRDTVDDVVYINKVLKENKLKVYSDYYPALGLIGLLQGDQRALMDDLVEVASDLRTRKKYKWLGKGMNLLMASALISSEYVKEQSEGTVVETALSLSIEAIIAAQQAAMIAAMAASSAAAAGAAT